LVDTTGTFHGFTAELNDKGVALLPLDRANSHEPDHITAEAFGVKWQEAPLPDRRRSRRRMSNEA